MVVAVLTLFIPALAEFLVEHAHDPVVILWARSISDSDRERCSAIRGLGALGSKKGIEPLRSQMSIGESDERALRAIALLKLGYSDDRVLACIDDALRADFKLESKLPLGVGMWLYDLGTVAAPISPRLLKFISECQADKGGTQAWLLANVAKDDPKVVEAIVRLLSRIPFNDSMGVRQGNLIVAIGAVAELGPPAVKAIPFLVPFLKHSAPIVSITAAIALIRIDPDHQPAIEHLRACAAGTDARARSWLAYTLAGSPIEAKHARILLRTLTAHPDLDERDFEATCTALSHLALNDEQIAAALRKRMSDTRPKIALAAAFALAQIRQQDAESAGKVLVAFLDHEDKQVRLEASRCCARLKTPAKDLVASLKKGLKSTSLSIAANCAETLLRIDDKDLDARRLALDLLRNKFEDGPDDFISRELVARECARARIAKFGAPFKEARPDLIAMLRSGDGAECEQAAKALLAIDNSVTPSSNRKDPK